MKKRLLAGLLVAMMMVSTMSTTALAANETMEPETYCVTLNVADLMALEQSAKQYVNPSLFLGGYQSGWATAVRANFTLPADAVVTKVKVSPGDVVSGGPVTSAIAVDKFKLAAPNGTSVDLSFSVLGMETHAFDNLLARGNWTLSFYGQNVGPSAGSIKYSNTVITIWYTR